MDMFGSKQAKERRLAGFIALLRERGEMSKQALAIALGVSIDTIEDDLISLHDRGVLVCQHGTTLSLLEHWT
jgi:DeoR/GlpR family transcriptional regulator of sugar metabolism